MRVLVAGDFAWSMYEPSFCAGLRVAGAEVLELPVARCFGPGALLRRAQTKYVVGPGIRRANEALVAACAEHRPDVVLAWRTPWLSPGTPARCRAAGARALVLSNNDDPFGPDRELPIWRAYRRVVPEADACFVYRTVNLDEHRAAGAREVFLLRSWYDPAVHRPITLDAGARARFGCDVVFVGHCELDERLDALEALLATGLRVHVHGASWDRFSRGRPLAALGPIAPVLGDDYARAIAAAKLALVFLSQRNRDQYTRRCFEIPAIGTAMLAPRTPELLGMFREREEAAYFGDVPELVQRARELVADDAQRERIARGGRTRVLRDGHDAASRARGFLRDVETLLGAGAGAPRRVVVTADETMRRQQAAASSGAGRAPAEPRWRSLLRRGLSPALKRRVAAGLCHPRVGRALGWALRDRVPFAGMVIDTSCPAVEPATKAALFFRMYESAEVRSIAAHLRRDLDVVELGASLGVVSAHVARTLEPGRRLVCVEPHPALGSFIERNVRDNAPGRDVVVLARALHYPVGPSSVRLELGTDTTTSRVQGGAGTQRAGAVEVPATTLSELLAEQRLGPYVLVCDIEGAEAGILHDDVPALAGCRQIVAELHATTYRGVRYAAEDLAGRLEHELGFRKVARDGGVWVFER